MVTDTSCEKKPLRIETAARGEIITVVVGPESVRYHVHKATLIEHSEFFERALEGSWLEADVRLEDIKPETFGIFVDWIYTQKLLLSPGAEDARSGEEQMKFQIPRLKASIFGDRFLSHHFSRAVRHDLTHALIEWQYLQFQTVIFAYANLPLEDPLLRLMEDVYCHHCGFDYRYGSTDRLSDLPKAFLLRVMKSLIDEISVHRENAGLEKLDECDYLNHPSEEDKAKCQSSS